MLMGLLYRRYECWRRALRAWSQGQGDIFSLGGEMAGVEVCPEILHSDVVDQSNHRVDRADNLSHARGSIRIVLPNPAATPAVARRDSTRTSHTCCQENPSGIRVRKTSPNL